MDLKQLRYFVALAELKSLTAAAERMNVTQPALGQQIRNLELDLGANLVERHSRGVHLTEAGDRLRTHAEDILSRARMAKEDLRSFSSVASGLVRVGVTPSLGRVIVPHLLERVTDELPEVKIQIVQNYTEELDQLMLDRKLDIAVTHSPIETDRLETIPLYLERIHVIGHQSLFEVEDEVLSLQEIAQLPLVMSEKNRKMRELLGDAITRQEVTLVNYLNIPAVNILRALVIQGRRCALAPRALFSHEIETGLLVAKGTSDAGLDRSLHLATGRVEHLCAAEAAVRMLFVKIVDQATQSGEFGWSMPST